MNNSNSVMLLTTLSAYTKELKIVTGSRNSKAHLTKLIAVSSRLHSRAKLVPRKSLKITGAK
jgi:hypothetical protein